MFLLADIKDDAAIDYENYVEFRRLTREAALENDIDLVRENYHRATAIYNLDPDIYTVAADFYMSQSSSYRNGEFADEYIEALDKVIELHVNDGKYVIARADFHRSREEYIEARRDFSLAMKIYPDDLWIPFEIVCNIQQEITSIKRRDSYVFKDYGDFVGEKNISSRAKSCLHTIHKTYPKQKQGLKNN